jgi:hypothetical protein
MNNEKIRSFIEANPKYLTGFYRELAVKFNVSYEQARHIARRMRKKPDTVSKKANGTSSFSENVSTGDANLSFNTTVRIKTKEDLINLGMVDLNDFEIERYEVTTWEGYRKGKEADIKWSQGIMDGYVKDSGKLITETLYRVNVKLKRRKLDTDLEKQKELILAEIKSHRRETNLNWVYHNLSDKLFKESKKDKYLLELCLFDMHFGKMSWSEETGEDFDLKIAEKRFKEAVYGLLRKVDLTTVEKILFPIGNDLINVDNKNNTTTAGTPQDTDSRFFKIIKVVRKILVEVIDELASIAPVDVVIVPGNHDESTSFFIGEMLDCFYHKHPRVNIDCKIKLRKYYQYGKVGLQMTHGNEEKHHDLGLIFATEEKKLWGDTDYRFCQLGHFHKNKKTEFVSVDEHQGFQIQILPSLSGTDSWHKKKGYMSKKQAKAFVFHKEEGMTGEFTVSI